MRNTGPRRDDGPPLCSARNKQDRHGAGLLSPLGKVAMSGGANARPARPDARGDKARRELQAAALTSIFLAWAAGIFGMVTVRTPFDMLALMCDSSTPAGTWMLR